jgi:hypothetical protein
MARKLPLPEVVFAEMPRYAAYAWACSGYGIQVFAESKIDAQEEFKRAFEREYGKSF